MRRYDAVVARQSCRVFSATQPCAQVFIALYGAIHYVADVTCSADASAPNFWDREMGRNTKEDALKTREKILDTAQGMFFERGVSQTSIEDIARSVGLTRGAIYWHFKNKADLFEEMVDRALTPFDDVSAASFSECGEDPLGQLRNLLVYSLLQLTSDPHRYVMIEILLFKWEHTKEMQSIVERKRINAITAIAGIKRALDCAVSSRQLPSLLDTAQAAIFLHSLLMGTVNDQLTLSSMPSLRSAQHVSTLIDSFLDMLRFSIALRQSAPLTTALA